MKIEKDINQVKNNDYKNNDIVCSTDILNDKINNKDILNCSTNIIDDQEDMKRDEKVSCHLQPSVASLHQIRNSSDDVYVDVCGAYVAPPPLREFTTGAVLNSASDVTKGLPQSEIDTRVSDTCCSKDASDVMAVTPSERLKEVKINEDEQFSSVADNNASSIKRLSPTCCENIQNNEKKYFCILSWKETISKTFLNCDCGKNLCIKDFIRYDQFNAHINSKILFMDQSITPTLANFNNIYTGKKEDCFLYSQDNREMILKGVNYIFKNRNDFTLCENCNDCKTFFNERVPFIRCLSHPLNESNPEGKIIHNLDPNNFIYLQEKDSIFESYFTPNIINHHPQPVPRTKH